MSLTRTCALLVTLSVPAWAQSLTETHKVLSPEVSIASHFGEAVAVDGDEVVVGVGLSDGAASFSGSAYLIDAMTGSLLFKLVATDGELGDRFGVSVDMDGGLVVVGAYESDDFGPATGSAYLFDRATGLQTAKLLASDSGTGNLFGHSVAISGNRVIVGAYGQPHAGTRSGAAYIFNATTGQQLVKLVPSDAAAEDQFGYSVGISGDVAIVGAHWDDDNGSGSGSAYLFDVNTGVQLAKLTPGDGQMHDRFGVSVAIDGAHSVICARRDDDNGLNSGSAYIFDNSSGQQIHKILPSDGSAASRFGTYAAISGTTVVVGATGHSLNGVSAGAAYLFDAISGVQQARLLPGDGVALDNFAVQVDIDGATAICGSPFTDDGGTDTGSLYFFDAGATALNSGVPYCFGDGSGIACPCGANGNSGEGCANSSGAGGAKLAASGSGYIFDGDLRLSVTGAPGAKPGLILRGNNALSLPVGDGILCTGGSSQRSQVQLTSSAGNSTFGNFNGESFASVANLGAPTRWQYWYRDSANLCSGAGFNFSNGWEVMYLP